MDRIAFSTLLMGLLVGIQPVRVEVSPDLSPAAIVYYLDGNPVGGATAPPWEAHVDFGKDLKPHELVAAAMNASGDRIASVSRIVNLPAPASRLDLLLERKGSGAPSSVRLVATSVMGEKPVKESLTLDGRPLALDGDGRAALPRLNLEKTHVLSGVAEFNADTLARADRALGGGIADESGSRLTAVAVRVDPASEPSVESLAGLLRHGSDTLRVVAIDRGPATVLIVRNPSPGGAYRSIGRGAVGRGPSLEDGDRVGFVWPISHESRIGDQNASLVELSPFFTDRDGSLLWMLTRVQRPATSDPPYSFSDAVAVAGLEAFQSGARRAVVLAGWYSDDASHLRPAQVTPYLRDLGVPLHVWTFGSVQSPWPEFRTLDSYVAFRKATDELLHDLSTQRIVWVAGEWDPGRIELRPGAGGVSLVR